MDCTLCREPITNPLCPGCLGAAVDEWAQQEAPASRKALQQTAASLESTHGETCIRCHKRFISCTYCTTKELFNTLKDGREQLQYLHYFNFFT